MQSPHDKFKAPLVSLKLSSTPFNASTLCLLHARLARITVFVEEKMNKNIRIRTMQLQYVRDGCLEDEPKSQTCRDGGGRLGCIVDRHLPVSFDDGLVQYVVNLQLHVLALS